MDNILSPQNYFQTNCRSVISMLLKKIRFNVILRTWDMFQQNGLTKLRIFFMTKSMFFSSTVFVIFRLLFFLIMMQYSKVCFEGAKKQARNYTENTLCYKCFQELGQNLLVSYFNELFPMYAKKKPVQYSPGGVLQPFMLVVTKGPTYLNLQVLVDSLLQYV